MFTDDRSDGKPGSSFWFEVPYAPDSVCTPPQGFCPPESSYEESSLKQISRSSTIESPHAMHILIVDDSIAVVKMLSNKLKVFSFFFLIFLCYLFSIITFVIIIDVCLSCFFEWFVLLF
jgi:hypothetical protein